MRSVIPYVVSLILFGLLIWSLNDRTNINTYKTQMDSLNSTILALKTKFDSLTPVENHYKTEITNIKKYYYNEKIKIDSIPDSNLVRWIRADLRNFDSSGTPYSR